VYAFGWTGQGRRCGRPTTRKEIARVVVKRDVVKRERGWRCGGIFDSFALLRDYGTCGVKKFRWPSDYDSIKAERN
jgi:hypothetical protein